MRRGSALSDLFGANQQLAQLMETVILFVYPTSLELISKDGFRAMRRGDDEIGYFLVEKPSEFYPLNLSVDGGLDSNLKVANLPSKSNLSAVNL